MQGIPPIMLNVPPLGLDVKESFIPSEVEGEEPTRLRTLVIIHPAISVTVGPMEDAEYETMQAFLADPQGETQKQQTRQKIMVANGGQMPPEMKIPKG